MKREKTEEKNSKQNTKEDVDINPNISIITEEAND